MPGPIPKRDSERVRRNKPDIPTDTVTAIGTVDVPDLGLIFPCDLVIDFWNALKDSAQSKYYEASDWQYARMALHFADGLIKSEKPSSMMLTVVNSMLADLLVAEGQRRRVRMEIEREQARAEVTQLSDVIKKRFENVS